MLHGAALHVPHDELKFCEVVKKTCPLGDVSDNRVYPKQFLDSNVMQCWYREDGKPLDCGAPYFKRNPSAVGEIFPSLLVYASMFAGDHLQSDPFQSHFWWGSPPGGESWLNSSFGEISICSGNIMLAGEKKHDLCYISGKILIFVEKNTQNGTKTPAGYHLVD